MNENGVDDLVITLLEDVVAAAETRLVATGIRHGEVLANRG